MRLQSGSCVLPLFRNQILSFPNPDVLRVWDLHTRMSEFRQNQQAREHLSENAPEPSQESLLYCFYAEGQPDMQNLQDFRILKSAHNIP